MRENSKWKSLFFQRRFSNILHLYSSAITKMHIPCLLIKDLSERHGAGMRPTFAVFFRTLPIFPLFSLHKTIHINTVFCKKE